MKLDTTTRTKESDVRGTYSSIKGRWNGGADGTQPSQPARLPEVMHPRDTIALTYIIVWTRNYAP